MIKFIENGNIFASKCDYIVNPVNTIGVMSAGLALQFKNRFPRNFLKYQEACKNKLLIPGRVLITREHNKFIVNFPTKKHWKDDSKLEYIMSGLKCLKRNAIENSIKSIAFPKLGCGLGNLSWKKVEPLILDFAHDLKSQNIIVEIYA